MWSVAVVTSFGRYAQSHVFPWDPFYEGRVRTMSGITKDKGGGRKRFMHRLQMHLEANASVGIPTFNSPCING
jgi:hypothetical protein